MRTPQSWYALALSADSQSLPVSRANLCVTEGVCLSGLSQHRSKEQSPGKNPNRLPRQVIIYFRVAITSKRTFVDSDNTPYRLGIYS
jgi:hypothetical protein